VLAPTRSLCLLLLLATTRSGTLCRPLNCGAPCESTGYTGHEPPLNESSSPLTTTRPLTRRPPPATTGRPSTAGAPRHMPSVPYGKSTTDHECCFNRGQEGARSVLAIMNVDFNRGQVGACNCFGDQHERCLNRGREGSRTS